MSTPTLHEMGNHMHRPCVRKAVVLNHDAMHVAYKPFGGISFKINHSCNCLIFQNRHLMCRLVGGARSTWDGLVYVDRNNGKVNDRFDSYPAQPNAETKLV